MKCFCNIISMHDPIHNSEYRIFPSKCNRIWAIWIHMIWITAEKMIIHQKIRKFRKIRKKTEKIGNYLLTNIGYYFRYHNSIWYFDACCHHFARVFEKLNNIHGILKNKCLEKGSNLPSGRQNSTNRCSSSSILSLGVFSV